MKIVVRGFVNTMSKPQKIAGLVYLPFHMFIIPIFLGMAAVWLPGGLDEVTATVIYYGIGFAFCLVVMWKFLRNAFDIMLDNKAASIAGIIFGYISCLLLSYLAVGALLLLLGDQISNPNNDAILDLASASPRAVLGLAVFLAPVVEEVLFRGVIFGSLRTRHRTAAFIVSIALFAFYHIWQLALSSMDWTMLVYMIQYIPAGYALAWAYEKTDSIWVPIFLHTLINGVSMLVLG